MSRLAFCAVVIELAPEVVEPLDGALLFLVLGDGLGTGSRERHTPDAYESLLVILIPTRFDHLLLRQLPELENE